MADRRAIQAAAEDYLKTIYELAQLETPVTTSRIALARQVQPPSVTGMVQKLHKLGLVSYQKHYGVELTEKGRRVALEIIRHHRLLELYMTEKLGFGWDEVHAEAEVLEHVISQKFGERIAAALDHPAFDPHGDPIPGRDGSLAVIDVRPLTELRAGQQGRVARIVDDSDPELLRYLAQLGIRPGVEITVLERAPYDGPITVLVAKEKTIIGHKAAQMVSMEQHWRQ